MHTDETERCVYIKYLEGELYIRRIVLDQEETSVSQFLHNNKHSWNLPWFLFIRNIKKIIQKFSAFVEPLTPT